MTLIAIWTNRRHGKSGIIHSRSVQNRARPPNVYLNAEISWYTLTAMSLDSITLTQWFSQLDQYCEPISLQVLTDGLERLSLDWAEVAPFVRFSPERYRRNLIHAGPAYHALLLCWRSGQESPIHDHRGSACAVRVILGEATETVYEMTEEGRVFPMRTNKLPAGFMCATQDLDIHKIANEQGGDTELITLHIYSPPLLVMGQYSPTDSVMREYHDEVCLFNEGAGI
jgi:cysteine dioxygenase